MQRVALLPLFLCWGLSAAARLRRSQGLIAVDEEVGHPVEKVIKLLKDLSADVKKKAQEEEYVYGKFEKWCKDQDKVLSKAIANGKEKIDSLRDKVSALEKEEKSLKKQIKKLEDEILEHEEAEEKAKEAREDENKLWEDADKDLEDTIKAIEDAVKALKESEPADLVQRKKAIGKLMRAPLMLAQLDVQQQDMLSNAANAERLLSSIFGNAAPAPADSSTPRPDLMAKGDLEKHQDVYVFKSGNVIELLKNLKIKFEDDRVEATKAETNAENAYQLAKDAREKAIETAKSSKKEKEDILGDVQDDKSDAESDLKDYLDDVEADEKSLETTKESCKQKAGEYADRTAVMASEQEAMAKAIEILAEVTGVRTKQPENPVPPPSPLEAEEASGSGSGGGRALLQMPPVDERQKAINLLRAAAKKSHSEAFANFAEQVAADADGPFKEVNEMMQKMIFRLMAEQKDEDEHKAWCDTEIEKANISATDKEERIDTLEAKIKDGKAKVGELSTEIEDALKMIADVEKFMKEATEVREESKRENKAAIKDAEDAQTAIAQATAVLEQHYKESGMMKKEDWEFVQEPVKVSEEPETWDSSYTGISDPENQPDGIVSMLKTIAADFNKMEADTRATEAMDQKAYEEDMKDSKIEKAERQKEADMKEAEKKRQLEKIEEHEKQKKHVSDELYQVEIYQKDLEPACIEGDSTYEDRKAARDAEIAAIKEAQVILEQAFDDDSAPAPAPAFVQLSETKQMPGDETNLRASTRQRIENDLMAFRHKQEQEKPPARATPVFAAPEVPVQAVQASATDATTGTVRSAITSFFQRLFHH
jgi:chromosome segregation ATPase